MTVQTCAVCGGASHLDYRRFFMKVGDVREAIICRQCGDAQWTGSIDIRALLWGESQRWDRPPP